MGILINYPSPIEGARRWWGLGGWGLNVGVAVFTAKRHFKRLRASPRLWRTDPDSCLDPSSSSGNGTILFLARRHGRF